jgi:hypothetical protein
LPNVDFENLNPRFDDIPAQDFVYSVVQTAPDNMEEISRAESLGLNQVRDFMAQYSLSQAGPLTRVIIERTDERLTYHVGYPYSGQRPRTVVGVQIGQTPSGQAMHVLIEGDATHMSAAQAQMDAYLQAHRIANREGAPKWHTVIDPGAADGRSRIEMFVPIQ